MQKYYVNFENDTDRTWNMAVYQTLPDSIGLDSVAWQVAAAPHSGVTGIEWTLEYNVALADYRQESSSTGIYKASQSLITDLGYEWEIVFQDGVQQLNKLQPLEADLKDHIRVINRSGLEANPGVGMSGYGSVFKRSVLGNASAQFKVTPTYWVGLFRDVQLGQVISSNVEVGPIEIQFDNGTNVATVTAIREGESIEVATTYSRT
ncbi:hypothetical protein [Pseudodesulfovibrio sp.]|uniref:hypothetical protein n=1 Tax=unclassified Pseudodesulfovibrio TaxID=2661612 RepID=UPI003B008BE1